MIRKIDTILSICIATYNNDEIIYSLVKSILKCKNEKLEVVVSDNCSTDNTLNKLESILDTRLKIFKNTYNLGPIYNYMSSLKQGTGKYLIFMTDKDMVKPEKINELISILNDLDMAVGYCELDYYGETSISKYRKGIESLQKFGYLSKHPTGYLFRKQKIDKLDLLGFYSKVENVGYFPFEFLAAELAVMGAGVLLKISVFYPRHLDNVEGNKKSATYSQKNNNLFFSWEQRYKMMERYLLHLSELDIEKFEKRIEAKKIFLLSWEQGSFGYKSSMENELVCEHYSVPRCKVTVWEMFWISNIFVKGILGNISIDGKLYKYIVGIKIYCKLIIGIIKGLFRPLVKNFRRIK